MISRLLVLVVFFYSVQIVAYQPATQQGHQSPPPAPRRQPLAVVNAGIPARNLNLARRLFNPENRVLLQRPLQGLPGAVMRTGYCGRRVYAGPCIDDVLGGEDSPNV